MLKSLLIAVNLCIAGIAFAGEGMWLPLFLKALNEAEMRSMGMKISAEDIYSVNQGSLKDAIAHFGGFCTSEIISSNGLLLTNHHCGYSNIQSHSSVENNLLKNGFWAKSHKEELPNPGLFVTFIDRIEDVTELALKGVEDGMTQGEVQAIVQANLDDFKGRYRLGQFNDIVIRPFYNGNQYFAFFTTRYSDVRLVGTPPESIGKFGSDTDNWVWPRHTGDFSLFRIYAGKDNQPAEYSEDNVPYKPKHFLPISIDGIDEGDFTMVFGFPGRTNQYLPSKAVEEIVEHQNPARIKIRDAALKIIDKHMRTDESIRIKYASKYARVANYWKKWIGESQGLVKTNAIEKKKNYEADFLKRARKQNAYGNIFAEFDEMYASISEPSLVLDYYSEIARRNIELLSLLSNVVRLEEAYEKNGSSGYESFKARLIPYMQGFYKDYESSIDREVAAALLAIYKSDMREAYIPASLQRAEEMDRFADRLYSETLFTRPDDLFKLLDGEAAEAVSRLNDDPAYLFYKEWQSLIAEDVNPVVSRVNNKIDSLQAIYMRAQMELFPERRFYPDANSTMRVTYGLVDGFSPADGVCYTPITYLDGVVAKYVPGDYEFDVPKKLLDLHAAKDYGPYADKTGKVPVCFLGSNHTTGGNSGSPAIDAYGNLVGLNFDRVWEGTMSDINYDVSICRNIMVDARYILFIVDKYAGAGHLINEMKLVRPKSAGR